MRSHSRERAGTSGISAWEGLAFVVRAEVVLGVSVPRPLRIKALREVAAGFADKLAFGRHNSDTIGRQKV